MSSKWNDLTARRYLGDYTATYFGYSLIDSIRENAASGGITSTLMIALLREGWVDGVLVCEEYVEDNEIKLRFNIATTEEEIYRSQGSIYVATRFSFEAIPLIRKFNGKVGVVCLPCDSLILNNLRTKDPEFDQKLGLVVTLFCGHNSEKELTQLVMKKLNKQKQKIRAYRHRFGHWRGNLRLDLEDSTSIVRPFSTFSDYQNMFFFCQTKCFQCVDQTGFYSDISIGDIWSMKMKKEPIKHNAIIVRTPAGERAIQLLKDRSLAVLKPVPVSEICGGQSRSLPLHANLNARAWAGRPFGLRLKPNSDVKPSLIDKAIAFVAIFNYWLSRKKWGQWLIEKMPRFVLKLYLYAFKALQVLQKPERITHKIGIIGGSFWGNRGAEAMLVTTLAELRKNNPDAEFLVYSIYPKKDRTLIDDPSIEIKSSSPASLVGRYFPFALLYWLFSKVGIKIWLPSAVRRLRECAVLYDIGGITFAERGAVLAYNVFSIWPAMLLGVPVVKLSQAVGPFNSFLNRTLGKIFLGKCQNIYSRGETTREHLKQLGINGSKGKVAADIAFAYRPEYSMTAENDDKVAQMRETVVAQRNQGNKVIIVSPSTVVLKKLESPKYENIILDSILQIDRPNYRYIFLPNSNRAGSEKSSNNDIIVIDKIKAIAAEKLPRDLLERIQWIDWDLNTKGIREIMECANIVITSRFHSMIAALSLSVPVYVIGWSHKYQEVLRMFDLEENATDYNNAASEKMTRQVTELITNETAVKSQIAAKLPGVVASSRGQFIEIGSLFN